MATVSVSAPVITKPERHLLSERFAFRAHQAPADASETQRGMLREFKRRLDIGTYQLVHEPCPCGVDARNLIVSEVDRYGLPLKSVMCMACGTVRIDPYLDTASLENFYSELYQDLYGRALEPDAYFERQRAYGRKIRSVLLDGAPSPSTSVLEVGCGAGGGLFEFQTAGFRTVGCDFSSRLISYGKQRCVRELFVGGITAVREHLPGERFDLIFLHHVYEHVSQPIGLLEELQTVLKPEGRILIIVPDLSRIDRYPNPAGNALDFFHVAHKYNYSCLGLQSIAAQTGLAARQLAPPERMRTAWSRSPELWVEMKVSAGNTASVVQAKNETAGQQLGQYLQRTEQLYRWGVCPAQVRQTIRNIRPDRVLSRVVRGWRSA